MTTERDPQSRGDRVPEHQWGNAATFGYVIVIALVLLIVVALQIAGVIHLF